MYKKSLLLVGLLASSVSVNAAIVDHGFYLTDTSTGLDWLDFNVTQNQSFNTVGYRIQSGDLKGWVYATGDQFDGLVGSFGGTPMTCTSGQDYCGWSTANFNVATAMLAYLGTIQYDYQTSIGILADEGPVPGTKWRALLSWQIGSQESETQDLIDTHFSAVDYDYNDGHVTGSFLVRTSEVPIPAAGWLFLSALLGLAGKRRMFHQSIG
jgi:hypothetical protein